MKYYCHSARSIPYIAGVFANVIVEVDDATNAVLSVAPLVPDTSAPPDLPSPQPSLPPEANVVSSALPTSTKSKES